MSEINVTVEEQIVPIVEITVDENAAQTAKDAAAQAEASLEGLQQDLNSLKYPTSVTKATTPVITAGVAHVNAHDFGWNLLNAPHTNEDEYDFPVSAATDGYTRFDILQGDAFGVISYKQGIEGETEATVPSADAGKIALASIEVNGAQIGYPVSPSAEAYIPKPEKTPTTINMGSAATAIYLPGPSAHLHITGEVTDIHYVSTPANAYLYPGRKLTMKNMTGHDVTIHHLESTNFRFRFPKEANFVWRPLEVVEFVLTITGLNVGYYDYVGAAGATKTSDLTNDSDFATNAAVAAKQDPYTDANMGAFEAAVPTVTSIADTDKVPLLIGSLRRMMSWASFKALFRTINGNSIFGSTDLIISSGVVTTLKTITSAALTTQDAAGFVAYINALGTPLVVAANETVEYQLSDTGRVFKLLLRGRSFGTGQPAITTADVEDATLWMNKDLRLSNYPSTRNDGVMPVNKALLPDANGNLKLYSMATMPAPFLDELIPDSYAPSNTGNFIIKGSFFTPTMTVVVTGQTVNYVTFISDNEVHANVTTGAAEGTFSVTLNNGVSATFSSAFLVVLGDVYKPVNSELSNVLKYDTATEGMLYTTEKAQVHNATWSKVIDFTKNIEIRINYKSQPFDVPIPYNDTRQGDSFLYFKRISDDSVYRYWRTTGPASLKLYDGSNVNIAVSFVIDKVYGSTAGQHVNNDDPIVFRWDPVNTEWRLYYLGNLKYSYTDSAFPENMYITFSSKYMDLLDIKYIELAT